MGQANSRHRLQLQQLRRLNAPMTGDDLVIVIYKKPNRSMLLAICLICLGEWVRALPE